MDSTNLSRQYEGFINTPRLWHANTVLDLEQFDLKLRRFNLSHTANFDEIRLGKRVEQFFNFQISQDKDYNCVARNIQIKANKQTIGELDALISDVKCTYHIEIVYKFYLYDDQLQKSVLCRWIGPNRKDALIYKLLKLKKRQLPLLFSKYCTPHLNHLHLSAKNIRQQVCYKAQLYLPYETQNKNVTPLNFRCVYGFHLPYNKIERLKNYMLFIPVKLNWLVDPHHEVTWLSFKEGKYAIAAYIANKRSPLVWLKSKNNTLQKCFITFW